MVSVGEDAPNMAVVVPGLGQGEEKGKKDGRKELGEGGTGMGSSVWDVNRYIHFKNILFYSSQL